MCRCGKTADRADVRAGIYVFRHLVTMPADRADMHLVILMIDVLVITDRANAVRIFVSQDLVRFAAYVAQMRCVVPMIAVLIIAYGASSAGIQMHRRMVHHAAFDTDMRRIINVNVVLVAADRAYVVFVIVIGALVRGIADLAYMLRIIVMR